MIATSANDMYHISERLKAKNREAFAELYDRYSPALFGFICKLVKNQRMAEELLQRAFIKIWKNIDNYDESKGTLFAWILRITRNTCNEYLQP
jgi:RNA polymerase sigma factor (sigma-70 family)